MEEALKVLKAGGVILYPTDTVWGLGCDATNEAAVAKIYAIKRRAEAKAMIMLVDSADNLARYVKTVPEAAAELIEAADGTAPLTLILPDGCAVAGNLLPDQESIAIRIPNHKFCIDLLRKLRRPLVSTSANISGEPTPATFAEISEIIKSSVDYIVPIEYEGNPTRKPSSIISIGLDSSINIIRA